MSLCKGQTWDVQLLVCCAMLCWLCRCVRIDFSEEEGKPESQDDAEACKADAVCCAVLCCCVKYYLRTFKGRSIMLSR